MKKIFLTIIFTIFANISYAKDLYKIDSSHANILWKASHFGFSSPSGKFNDVEGTILIDSKNIQNSSVEVTIKTASIATGLEKFDNHLKSPDFFNSTKFPTATFKSSAVSKTSATSADIRGELTILGITKMITLKAKLNKIGTSPITQKQTVGFSASTAFKRSDFNMNFGLPGISDKVDIEIELEASLISSDADEQGSNFKKPVEPKVTPWKIIANKSKVEFQATQDSSPIRGSFTRFDGEINFNKNALSKSDVKIEIDTTSIETSFAGALEALKSTDWLSVKSFSKATFEAKNFFPLAGKDEFRADGILTIKGKSVRTSLEFTLQEYSDTKAKAVGKTTIKRSQFGIGDSNPRKANGVKDDIEVTFVIEVER